MHNVNVAQLDLNLLKVFQALHEECSVTRAGLRLGLSQSSVSHALNRLRDTFGDQLFLRGSRGVHPTQLASMLAGPISEALQAIQIAFDEHNRFEPGNSNRTFRLLMTDTGEAFFGPQLISHLRKIAPSVRIVMQQLPRHAYKQALEQGDADLALGQLPEGEHNLMQQQLSIEHFYGFACIGNPILADPSIDRFLQAEHLIIGTPAVAEAHLARALGPLASRRRIALQLSHYLSAGPILMKTDLIAVLPQTVTEFLIGSNALGRFVPPIPIEPVIMRQFWHARTHADAGNQWLRSQIAMLFQGS